MPYLFEGSIISLVAKEIGDEAISTTKPLVQKECSHDMRQHDEPPGENQGSKKHDKQLAMAVAHPEHWGNSRKVSLMSGPGTFA
ncbi:hypothetical protein [Anaerobiospirillum sp. NML120511]|uniref:hypothetical protein n=1 Tax=Anaerobiospirillum sp. NML120511 TaxID=2932819 RepID=UPI001FF3974C|nr:hypothetical protein [Anaerobiospirillum sp. NML120511]MCK0533721.1 hypothetical protein [Anaerobiospirillum sp. NML120511]